MKEFSNNEILISIIVPVYNIEKYLTKCVESIINQSYKTLEIILVDDGSTDSSGRICDDLASRDNRIRVIHKINGGLSDARNAGIDTANGEYIGFIDGDDYIAPEMYETLLNACISNKAIMSICGRFTVDERGNIINKMFTLEDETVFSGKEAVEHLLRWDSCDSAAWDKLYKKELFNEVRYPLGVMSEDYQITPKLMIASDRVVHVGHPFYYYVQREGSITHQPFTQKRIDVLEQVHLMTDYIIERFPDLDMQCDYFEGRHLISIQRFAFYNTDPQMRKSMIGIYNICKQNKNKVIKCKLFSVKQKVWFLMKNFLLPIKEKKV